MLMESHTQILLVIFIKKKTVFICLYNHTHIHIFNLVTLILNVCLTGSPVYYVLLQCGTKEYRSKLSKGSSFVIVLDYVTLLNQTCFKWYSWWKQVMLTRHCGIKSLCLISQCLNGRSWHISSLESWTKSFSKMVDLLVKPGKFCFKNEWFSITILRCNTIMWCVCDSFLVQNWS